MEHTTAFDMTDPFNFITFRKSCVRPIFLSRKSMIDHVQKNIGRVLFMYNKPKKRFKIKHTNRQIQDVDSLTKFANFNLKFKQNNYTMTIPLLQLLTENSNIFTVNENDSSFYHDTIFFEK